MCRTTYIWAGVAVIFIAAGTLKLHFIRNDGGPELLWNADEAYVFVVVENRGFRISYLEYPWELFKELLNSPPFPDDEAASFTVIHVTAASVERYPGHVGPDGSTPGLYTPIEGRIYANCPDLDGLCWWNGTRFEAAPDEERKRLGRIEHLTPLDFDKVDGWSKRERGMPGNSQEFTVDFSGKFSILVKNEAVGSREYPRISISLLRASPAHAERILYIDKTPRWVSRSEYEGVFERR